MLLVKGLLFLHKIIYVSKTFVFFRTEVSIVFFRSEDSSAQVASILIRSFIGGHTMAVVFPGRLFRESQQMHKKMYTMQNVKS